MKDNIYGITKIDLPPNAKTLPPKIGLQCWMCGIVGFHPNEKCDETRKKLIDFRPEIIQTECNLCGEPSLVDHKECQDYENFLADQK